MNNLTIVFSGPKYNDYCMNYTIDLTSKIFPNCEIIVSTNDRNLASAVANNPLVNKLIISDNIGELPSLKYPENSSKIINNNINKQNVCCLKGVLAASHNIVLRIRTDQVLLNNNILKIWDLSKNFPSPLGRKGKIITSSIFSINPRYSERMPYHISDMLQFGYKDDIISYFSVPNYPFEYATWYERNPHIEYSNKLERTFRSKFAVEQWLTLHYIFNKEENFPIRFHNDFNDRIIDDFENNFIDYFIIAHPKDIGLRAPKFKNAESYYSTQCYSTFEVFKLLENKYPNTKITSTNFTAKGMNKKYFNKLMPIIYSPFAQFLIKRLSTENKNRIKRILNHLAK
ncbi:hypothetical protein J5I17_09345 [Escherichia coli]|uniref:WavE lipopolysaccharide synthesis family protein n=2 Tax=Enterobacteriaceae TaxID=543 RepID=UPI0003EF596B|nr:WavE lipopolysaccharide synthesis family protein [Escherichia coli]EFE7864783.1 hypothetical protein [Escherichia coli]MCX3671647.1 hypothetical protein [Escherichia coli]HBB9568574.1 hypothetical protein [Escherichia coli]